MSKAKSARVLQISPDAQLDKCATEITHALQKTVEGIFETGRLLTRWRERLEHGNWMRLFDERRVPISLKTAERFMGIWKSRDRLLPKQTLVSILPASYSTLSELAALPDDTLAWAHEQGRITPQLERADVKRLRTEFAAVPISESARDSAARFLVSEALRRLDQTIHAEWQKWPPEHREQFLHTLTQLHQELRDER